MLFSRTNTHSFIANVIHNGFSTKFILIYLSSLKTVFCETFNLTKTVLAIYIDEYVPKITPKIIANEKPFKISPPKKNIDNKANKVVTDVIKVLDKVSFIEIFVKS